MKVKPTNRKLWKSFGGYVSIINTALSLILMFVSVPDNSALKIWLAAIFAVVLIALFCFLWWKANNTTSVRLKINSTIGICIATFLILKKAYNVIGLNLG